MDKFISGKQFKQMIKGCTCVVFRINGEYQDIEFDYKNPTDADTRGVIQLHIPSVNMGNHCFVYQYVNQADTTIQYFSKSLKPKDEVRFYARTNGSELLTSKGIGFIELRARITSRFPDNFIKDVRECTVKSEHFIIK